MFRRIIANCFGSVRFLALCCIGLLLSACSIGAAKPNVAFPRPLAPLLESAPRQLSQQLAVSFRGNNHTLLAATLIEPQQIKTSLLTPQGVSLVDIMYDGQQIDAQQYLPTGKSIPPTALVADFQLVYWPLTTLQQSLPEQWNLREFSRNGRLIRQLWLGDNLHTEVSYQFTDDQTTADKWSAEIHLQQMRLGYSLGIKNL